MFVALGPESSRSFSVTGCGLFNPVHKRPYKIGAKSDQFHVIIVPFRVHLWPTSVEHKV
jgi:hypothetical protein